MKNSIMKFGYKEKKIKAREMSMQTMQVLISQILYQEDMVECEIRIVDVFSGSVDKYEGMEALLCESFTLDWKVNVYRIRSMVTSEGQRYLNVIIDGVVESDEESNFCDI